MKKLTSVLRRVLAVFLAFIMLVLTVVTGVGIVLANNYSAMVTMALGQSSYTTSGGRNPQYFVSDYPSDAALADASAALCLEIEREGMILLKNDNNALPLSSGAKISLLSQNSVDLVYGGAGAGSVDTSTAADLKIALEASGFSVNPTLWDFYAVGGGSGYRKEVPNVMGMGALAAHEVPQSVYTQEVLDSLQEYNDAGIVVIGRTGSESMDLPAEYLKFTAEEIDLIKMACERFDTVVLLLNTTNAMNLSVLDEYDIDACLWIGALGQEGVYAVGEALAGTINPSGHLVDTYAYDPLSAPSVINLGDYTITNSSVDSGNKYIVYAEGIYVGYRYYETRYEDVVLGNESAVDYSYASQVQFPFGYGLSYTDFAWSNYQVTETGDSFTVSVDVKNTGRTGGKEVVQIYLRNPYTQYDIANHIEKPAVELVGFGKTALLAPGDSETVTIRMPKDVLKVYDAEGYGTYIVEAGDYYLGAGRNAHDALNNILAAKGYTTSDGMTASGDASMAVLYVQETLDSTTYAVAPTGAAVENQLADVDIRYYDDGFTYLSRSDWSGTWPSTYKNGSWTAPETLLTDLEIIIPEDATATMPTFGVAGDVKLADLIGLDYDDPKWETLLSEMSLRDTYDLIRHAGYGTMAVESVSAPGVIHKDGPAGISSTLAGGGLNCMAYPPAVVLASTWNEDLVEKRGTMVGEDSLSSGVAVWYAPAMNIHRAALSGRNFEYYSEDSFLSGKMGAAETRGFQSKGGIVTIKHFALNDQETNRTGGSVFSSEQTARELYLKPFEMSVTEGGALGIMSSMNRLGGRWIGGHPGVMTNILRGEWGYNGFVITDQTSFPFFSYCEIREGLAAGNDLWLNTAYNMWALDDKELTPTVAANARTAAHRYLYAVANSNAMNGIDHDTQTKNVWAGWQWLQIPLVIIVLALDVGCFFAFRKLWGKRNKRSE